MKKRVGRPRYHDLIDLIVGTYVKSLKAPLPFGTPSVHRISLLQVFPSMYTIGISFAY